MKMEAKAADIKISYSKVSDTKISYTKVSDTKISYTLEEFKKIIEQLRAEDGCPWDREQTHESLKPCITEEAAELVSSIRIYEKTGNPENMMEELGDVLLQVVMHTVIAEEEGIFKMEDVFREVSEKMIRRHPHVFGELNVDSTTEVLRNWDEIKKKEKEGKDWIVSDLREIPVELPALIRAEKVQKKVDKIYQKRNSAKESIDIMRERLQELEENLSSGNIPQEKQIIGDLLIELTNISGSKKLNAEQILTDAIEDVIERYEP